jgi:hypothetical protein
MGKPSLRFHEIAQVGVAITMVLYAIVSLVGGPARWPIVTALVVGIVLGAVATATIVRRRRGGP